MILEPGETRDAAEQQQGGTSIGALLRQWRAARGLSLGGLALQSGLAKSTLSRWETGTRQPSIAELEAVLRALRVTPEQHREALSWLDAPRGARRLREVAAASPVGAPPTAGELLRAMRLRRGMTQEAVASRLGIWKSTLSRWERGDDWPVVEHLHALCWTLGAHPEEVEALTRGGVLVRPSRSDTLDSLQAELRAIEAAIWSGERDVIELRCLALQAQLWPGAQAGGVARQLLAEAYARHAQWLSLWRNGQDQERLARRVLDLVDLTGAPQGYWAWAVHLIAMDQAYGRKRHAPLRAALFLKRWLPVAQRAPFFEAWVLRDIAQCLADAGRFDAALTLSARECRLLAGDEAELRHARLTRARLLVRAGRPHAALSLLPDDESSLPIQQIREGLLWAEALLACEDGQAAQHWVLRSDRLIQEHGLEDERPAVALLARRL